MKAKYIAIAFSSVFFLNIPPASAEQTIAASPDFQKSLTIIFKPPKGMENEFLNSFVKNQSEYMGTYSNHKKGNTEIINLIPTELGEPLIHLMIYHDKDSYDRATKIFSTFSNLKNYISGHAKTYDGNKIPKVYLQNSKIHFSNVVKN